MAKQREEIYCAVASGGHTTQHCVVTGCNAPIVGEVYKDDYAAALELFRGVRRGKVRTRRVKHDHLFACEEHEEYYKRTAGLRWQQIFIF